MIGNLLLSLAAAAPPSTANAPAPPAKVAAAPSRDAQGLAQTVAPHDIMISLNMEWGKRAVFQLFEQNAELKAVEAEYPGAAAAIWTAVEQELKRQLEGELPDLWNSLERLYLSELNDKELAGLLRFYRTPTGQQMIRSMYGNLDFKPVISSMAGDGQIDEMTLGQAELAARNKTVANLAYNEADLKILADAISVARLRAVGLKVQKVAGDWLAAEDPEKQARIDKLMADALEQHIASHDAKAK